MSSSTHPVDAVVMLQLGDVAHFAAHRERFAELPMLFIDPGILDAALQAGATRYELRRLDLGRDFSATAHTEAMTVSSAIDLALTEVRQELWGADALNGWDLGLLYLTLQRAFTMRALGRAMERSFPEARLGVFRPANPALFNWDSMLSADVVAADPARWSVVDRYAQGRFWNPAILDLCLDFEGIARLAREGHAECVTHIPTCFYDTETFVRAVTEAHERNIDLPGLYCDVPVRRGDTALLRRLGDAAFDTRCTVYRERAREVFRRHLAGRIATPALEQQVDTFARRSHLQAVNYVGLGRALAGTRPHFVLGDHDIGNNGPIFSVAAALGSPITVLPHSAYPTTLMPHARQVTVVERDGVGVPVRTVLNQPVATRAVRFRAPVAAVPRPAARRLLLLPNTMLSEGLSYVELFAMIGFFKSLSELCRRHGADLEVRLKPSTPALSVVAAALRMPAGYFVRSMARPLDELATEVDLCIAFGEPTSATITFLDAGCLVMNVSEQDRPDDYVITTPLRAALMPSAHCAEALLLVDGWLADPARYAEARDAQAEAYARRRVGAHDRIFPHAPHHQGA